MGSARASRAVFRALAEHEAAMIEANHWVSRWKANRPAGAPVGTREGACAPKNELHRSVLARRPLRFVEASLLIWEAYGTSFAVLPRQMKGFTPLFGAIFAFLAAIESPAAEVRTNWVDTTVTNVIEVRIPRNQFVTEFRTNFVTAYKTNFETVTLTNEVVVNLVRTNLVNAFKTNWQSLSFANFEAAAAPKSDPAPAIAKSQATSQPAAPAPKKALPPANARPDQKKPAVADSKHDPVIEATRTTKPSENGMVEIELKIHWPDGTVDAPPVRQWRIERKGGSFLSLSQDQECRRELPVGTYIIQALLQRLEPGSPSFVLKAALEVTIKEAVVQPTDKTKVAFTFR